MNFQLITDIVSLVLLAMGGVLVFATAIGLVRFQDTMSRVHPVTKPQTLGLVMTILGAFIRVVGAESSGVSERSDLGMLLLLVLFAMMTSPVTAQRMSRIARREGLYGKDENMTRNDRPAGKKVRRK